MVPILDLRVEKSDSGMMQQDKQNKTKLIDKYVKIKGWISSFLLIQPFLLTLNEKVSAGK